jgi:hypothetical protein
MTAHQKFPAFADDPELAFFNAQDVRVLLGHLGFTVTPKDCNKWAKGSTVYSAFLGRAGAWICTDHRAKRSHGVVSLIRAEMGLSLGAARIELRKIFGTAAAPSHTLTPVTTSPVCSTSPVSASTHPISNPAPAATPEKISEADLLAQYARGMRYDPTHHPGILSARGIDYIAPDYHDAFRLTQGGSVVFPTYNFDGETGVGVMSGYETCRADGRRFFVKGGSAGIWTAGIPSREGVLLIAESPYDALALTLTHHLGRGHALCAVRSGAEKDVANLARWMINEELINIILISTDNDGPGLAYAAKILMLIEDMKRRGEIQPAFRIEYVPAGYRPREHYVNDPNEHLQRILTEIPETRAWYVKLREEGDTDRRENAGPTF